jgi:hypothetical protein
MDYSRFVTGINEASPYRLVGFINYSLISM